jgi:hypothetical protein
MAQQASQRIQTRAGSHSDRLHNLVQRKACAWGRPIVAGRNQRLALRRRAVNASGPETAPPMVHEVLRSSGQPLDAETRFFMERRFGHDFSGVRVHTDAKAAESARALNAQAYTVGDNIVFGAKQYASGTIEGRSLLAHELSHVVQQQVDTTAPQANLDISPPSGASEREADHMARAVNQDTTSGHQPPISRKPLGHVLQRRSIFEEIAGLFRGDSFGDEELQEYLAKLDRTGTIEDFTDSDNKARAIVQRWKRGDSAYVLPARRKILLIQEMLSGFTGDDDERAILDILRGSTDAEFSSILARVGQPMLEANFHGEERAALDELLTARRATTTRTEEPSPGVFPAETVLQLERRFKSNTGAAVRLNCILIIRELAPELFALDPELAERVRSGLGTLTGRDLKMTEAGRVLSDLGLVTDNIEIRFNNGNGIREPIAMEHSAWDTIIGLVDNFQGWHIFGMAVFDGYHSVTVFVDNRPDGPRVYWADQWRIDPGDDFYQEPGSVSGFRRYEKEGFDRFINEKTNEWWKEVLEKKGKRYKASLHIWKFRSSLPTAGSR